MSLRIAVTTILIILTTACKLDTCKAESTTFTPLSKSDSIYLEFVGKADSAIAQANWAEAEIALLNAIHQQPSNQANVLLLSNLAIVRFQQGNDSIALATINDALIIAPKSITALNNRARILKSLGKLNEAAIDYETILSIDSGLIEPRYMHGIIALTNNDIVTAKADFDKLERLAPYDELTLDAMALFYFQTQAFDKALPYYTKLISTNPNIDNYSSKILCHLFCEELSEASSAINDAIKLYPLEGGFYLHRAFLNHLYFRQNDCEADLKKALEMGIPAQSVNAWRELINSHNN